MRRTVSIYLFASAVAVFALPACKRKDPAKCESAKQTIRTALSGEDFASANQWREYAYKQCDSADMPALDQEIVAKQTEVNERKAKEEAQERETTQLVNLFSSWVGQHRGRPEGAAVSVVCRGEENDKKERWCTRQRSVGGKYQVSVNYWEGEPAAHEFVTVAQSDVACDKFGSVNMLSRKHDGAWQYCDITGGTLAGMKALIRRGKDGVHISVFSPKYLERNAGFARIVQQG